MNPTRTGADHDPAREWHPARPLRRPGRMTVVRPDPDRAQRGPARVAPRPAAEAARSDDGGAGVDRRRSRSVVVRWPAAENSDPQAMLPCRQA